MTNNCKGPCLKHCYNKNSMIIFLLGFLIGYLICNIKNTSKTQENN